MLYFEVFASYEQLGITADEKYLGFTVGSAGGSGWYASENTHADQGILWDRADIAQNFKITEEGLFVKLDPDTCEHLFSNNPVVTNPSCSEDGNNAYTCRLCGHVKNEPIPSTGNHNYEEVVSTVPSTCTTVGTQVLGCTGCDEETEVDLETLDKEIKRLNLDKPICIQYLSWAKSFIKGDLGYTSTGEKVSTKLKERIPLVSKISVWETPTSCASYYEE